MNVAAGAGHGGRSRVAAMLLGGCLAAAPACDGVAGAFPDHAGAEIQAVDETTAERIVREYFRALAAGSLAEARNLLAAGPRSDASDEELAADAGAVLDLEVQAVRVADRGEARILVEVELVPASPGAAESASVMLRWLELVRDRRGWRIARVADRPIDAAPWSVVVVWAQVNILEAEMALEVPHGWPRRGHGWSWTDPGGQGGDVSLQWSTAEAGWASASELPSGVEVMRTTPLELGWGSGTEYVVRAADSTAAAVPEIHLVARSYEGARVVRLVARPAQVAGIGPFRSVLRRMARSVELHDPSSLTTHSPAGPHRR